MIHLAGSSVMYSARGSVHVEGRADRLVDVTVGGVAATVTPVEVRPTSFSADLVLEPGVHVIAVTAADRHTGAPTTQFVTAIVDPSLEEQFAYLYIINGSVVADFAEWFTGEEALQAAREDGALPPEDEGFYIRNLDPSTQVLTLADTLSSCCGPATRNPTWGASLRKRWTLRPGRISWPTRRRATALSAGGGTAAGTSPIGSPSTTG
ncbi:MAG TPA: hypothetical protein VMX37_03240 [Acidimicrobiia bacterium]|nr:hypothetical protein [Acidimicrobiia bacterium]